MNRFWSALLLFACSFCVVHADYPQLQEKLMEVVGEIPVVPSRPTVRSAAREYILGRQFAAKDQYGLSMVHYRRSARLDEHSSAPWVGMAISLAALNRDDSAIVAWKEVIARDPINKDALLILGLDAARTGQIEKGKLYLSQHWLANKALPIEALLRVAGLLFVYESDVEVTSLLEETVNPVVESAVFDLVAGASGPAWRGVLQQLVDLHAIHIALQIAERAAPHLDQEELGTILTLLPVLEAASGGDGAITQRIYEHVAIHQNIPIVPRWYEPIPLFEALSFAAQSMSIIAEDPCGSIRLYKASLALQPSNALVINNLAWITLERDGPTEEVQRLCADALQLNPRASYILDTVGWMYTKLGNTKEAIPLLVESLQVSMQPSVETYDHLGDAYWISGQYDYAVRAWQTASMILHAKEYRQGILDGYVGMAHSVWGITVVTPEALYDFELGEVTRRLEEKLAAAEAGCEPSLGFAVPTNGAE